MAKNVTNSNVTDQVRVLREFSAKNPYGETFLDKMLKSLVVTGRRYTKEVSRSNLINMYFTAKEEINGDEIICTDKKIDEMDIVKQVDIRFDDLQKPRKTIRGKEITCGFIPINQHDTVLIDNRTYSGGLEINSYYLVHDKDSNSISFHRWYHFNDDYDKEPEYVIKLEDVTGVRATLTNEFDETLCFSGFVNSLKHNELKNDKETDEFMISECVYMFLVAMYRSFKFKFYIGVKGIPNCFEFSTSLFTRNALTTDLTCRHQYLYEFNNFLIKNGYNSSGLFNEVMRRQLNTLTIFKENPFDLSWAIFEETSKIKEYLTKHFKFFKTLALSRRIKEQD